MNSKMEDISLVELEEVEHKVVSSFRGLIERLTFLWKEFGLSEDQKRDRISTVHRCITTLINELQDEENKFYTDLKQQIQTYQEELNKLVEDLGEMKLNYDLNNMALLEKEKCLRTIYESLMEEKQSRVKTHHELRKVESKICNVLDLPIHKMTCASGVPSKQDLLELEQHVNMLKEEKEKRYLKYSMAKRELTTIFETTELLPETSFERDVVCYDDDHFVLSNENLKELEHFVSKVQHKRSELEEQKKGLVEKLQMLYDRLGIDAEERTKFLSKHVDCRVSTLQAIHEEIGRCEEIKRQNLKSYIEKLQKELEGYWNKCFTPEEERQQFLSCYDNEISEMALSGCEREVQKMKQHYEEISEILKKIEERQQLWELMLVFENKASDPNRFVNRGGKLLQEERERKRLQKDLPKLETELFKIIDGYEAKSGKPFFYNGVNFQQYVTEQWEQRLNQKENEKLMRQKQRTQQLENEMTLGTPKMNRRPLVAPMSAPSRMLRSNTKLFTTGINLKTPDIPPVTPEILMRSRSRGCKSIKTLSARTSPRLASASKIGKSVLKENNFQRNKSPHNSTTYLDFATELNKISRSGLRSSVLACKIGHVSRSCLNSSRSKRKSSSKSANRKSLNKTPAKLAPARGKLGLPFLI